MTNENKYYTDLDKHLQDLAAMDWAAFVQLVGESAIDSAKAVLLRRNGRSYGQIAQRLDIPKSTARNRAKSGTVGNK